MSYMLRREKLPLLPTAKDDTHAGTTEWKVLQDRHQTYAEHIEKDGLGKRHATGLDLENIERSNQGVDQVYGKSNP